MSNWRVDENALESIVPGAEILTVVATDDAPVPDTDNEMVRVRATAVGGLSHARLIPARDRLSVSVTKG